MTIYKCSEDEDCGLDRQVCCGACDKLGKCDAVCYYYDVAQEHGKDFKECESLIIEETTVESKELRNDSK